MQIDQNIIVFIQVLYANSHFCIKYLDENNIMFGVDTSELTIGGVQKPRKLVLELSCSGATNNH